VSRLLLDTHTFFWFVYDDPKLSRTARDAISDPGSEPLVSIASVWESSIKAQRDQLSLYPSPVEFFNTQAEKSGLGILPIELSHLVPISALPLHHRDPFDRLLIAQALVEGIPIVSRDTAFDAYEGLTRLW